MARHVSVGVGAAAAVAVVAAVLAAAGAGSAAAAAPPPRVTVSYKRYVVLGAGPAGLQMAHYLQSAGRDYVVLDKVRAQVPRGPEPAACFRRPQGELNEASPSHPSQRPLTSSPPSQ
jgi:hypothetical protein